MNNDLESFYIGNKIIANKFFEIGKIHTFFLFIHDINMSDQYIVPHPIAIKIRNVNPMWAREYYTPVDEYQNVMASTPMWSTMYPVMDSYPIHNVNPYPYTVHQRQMAQFHPFMNAGYSPKSPEMPSNVSYPNMYRVLPLHHTYTEKRNGM